MNSDIEADVLHDQIPNLQGSLNISVLEDSNMISKPRILIDDLDCNQEHHIDDRPSHVLKVMHKNARMLADLECHLDKMIQDEMQTFYEKSKIVYSHELNQHRSEEECLRALDKQHLKMLLCAMLPIVKIDFDKYLIGTTVKTLHVN